MKQIRVFAFLIGTFLLAFGLARLSTPSLDFFFLDWRQILMNGKTPENPFVILNVSDLKLSQKDHRFSTNDFIVLVKNILKEEPKALIISLSTDEFKFNPDFQTLSNQLSQFPKTYVLTSDRDKREISLRFDPSFVNYKNFLSLALTSDTRYDRVSRRIITFYDLERQKPDPVFKDLAKLLPNIHPPSHFKKDFEYMGTKQVLMKIWMNENFNEQKVTSFDISENLKSKIADKIVFLGAEDIYSMMNTPSIKYRTTFFSSPEIYDYLWQDTKLASTYLTNLLSGEYIKSPSTTESTLWIFFWLSIQLGIIFFAPIKKALWISLTSIAIFLISSLTIFWLNPENFDIGKTLITTLAFQYIVLSVRYIQYARRADADRIKKDGQLALQKVKNSFLIRVAQADLSMRVAAQVSHDIRSPLMALQIVSSIVKDQISTDARELLVNSTERIKFIANDILSKYKGESESSGEDATTELSDAIEDLTSSFKTLHKDIEISSEIQPGMILSIPYFSFQRCLSNVLTNAAEALQSTSSAKIEIQAQQVESKFIIDIKDNGPGVAQEIRTKLFQERATFGKTSGTGLGLNQVKTELADFGGYISLVESHKGAHFKITMPADLSQVPIKVSRQLLILENRPELSELLEETKPSNIEVHSFNKISEIKTFLSGKNDLSKFTLITDLFFSNQAETGLDLLESHRGFFKIIICTPLVENKDIQEIATLYQALLLKKNFVKRMVFSATPPQPGKSDKKPTFPLSKVSPPSRGTLCLNCFILILTG